MELVLTPEHSQTADGDGGDSLIFWPEYELSKEYLTPVALQYYSGSLTNGSDCFIDNVSSVITSGIVTGALDYPNPKKIYWGDGSASPVDNYIAAGSRINCSNPFFVYIEPNQDDEANVLSWKQARQYQYPEPTLLYGAEESNVDPGYSCYLRNGELSYFNVSGLEDKTHIWSINCTDNSTNKNMGNSSTWNFTVDTISPTPFSLILPINITVSSNSTPTLTWTTTSEVNFYRYYVQVDDSVYFDSIDNEYYTYDITNISHISNLGYDTSWYWRATAVDKAGNNYTTPHFLYITDNTNPSVGLLLPNNGGWLNFGNVEFSYNAVDLYLKNCTLWGNFSGIWKENQTNSTVSSGVNDNFDSIILGDGNYIWNVVCYDNASNYGWNNTNYSIYVDTTKPSIDLSNPLPYQNISSSTVEFNFTVNDNLDLTTDCNLTIDGAVNVTGLNPTTGIPYQIFVSNLEEGDHYWNVTCIDNANNTNTSLTRAFTVDLGAPNVYLESPVNETNLANPSVVEFRYNVSDAATAISHCDLIVNGTINQTNNTVTKDVSMFFSQYIGGGDYTWSVNCTDTSGRTGESVTHLLSVSPPVFIHPISNYGEAIDRDKVKLYAQDNTTLVVKLSNNLIAQSVNFYANLTNPSFAGESNILLGTSISNSSGNAILNFSGRNSVGNKLYAGNYTWWAQSGIYIMNGSSTVIVMGGLNISFRFKDELPDLVYGKNSEAEIQEFLKSLGPESDGELNGTYQAKVNATIQLNNGTNYTFELIDPEVWPEPKKLYNPPARSQVNFTSVMSDASNSVGEFFARYNAVQSGVIFVRAADERVKLKSRIVDSKDDKVKSRIKFYRDEQLVEEVKKDDGVLSILEDIGWKSSPSIIKSQ